MTKDLVLMRLLQSNNFISGESISKELGISRAAVNVAVKNLRLDGYEILSTTKRGYKLTGRPDVLRFGELAALLGEERMKTVMVKDSVSSTNDYLRELACNGAPEGQVVLADYQTHGKGRRGREFISPAGSGIYLSILLKPKTLPSDTAEITAWTAVAVQEAIYNITGVSADIKWINDLLCYDKKLCGILTELSVEAESGQIRFVIVGIGINVNNLSSQFPDEIKNVATSLYLECGKKIDRVKLAAELICQMDKLICDWPKGHAYYLEAYRKKCSTPGHNIRIFSGADEELAYAEGIDDNFGLIVRKQDGLRKTINSGEISIRNIQ